MAALVGNVAAHSTWIAIALTLRHIYRQEHPT